MGREEVEVSTTSLLERAVSRGQVFLQHSFEGISYRGESRRWLTRCGCLRQATRAGGCGRREWCFLFQRGESGAIIQQRIGGAGKASRTETKASAFLALQTTLGHEQLQRTRYLGVLPAHAPDDT